MLNSTKMAPSVVLFGYDSSPFTKKVRFALRVKQVPHDYVIVTSMLPRPVLRNNFHLGYRKIPVCIIGREVYCDTSIILEALEHYFPPSAGYGTLYPAAQDGRTHRALLRGFASYWTDRPLFRFATGLIPAWVWRTDFHKDREGLIGHPIDAAKLAKKIPENLSGLDMQLSILEPSLAEADAQHPWLFSTATPSLADIALFTQLNWGAEISAGTGASDLTGGARDPDSTAQGAAPVFNALRYPRVFGWFEAFRAFHDGLPSVETRRVDPEPALAKVRAEALLDTVPLLPTPVFPHAELDRRNGLVEGALVSVAPDDTGRAK